VNLATAPAVPWSVGAMALVLLAAWTFLNGNWGGRSGQARRALLRAHRVPPSLFAWALLAGGLSLVALSGLWIVLFQLVKIPGNVSDFSTLPALTYFAALVMAALSGAVTEEAGFRGYFQGTLERHLGAPFAIALSALAMVPEHASTQGFVWPTVVFYLVVDAMLGTTAYLTRSILPGIVVHAIGLMMFFGLIWPHDHQRVSVWLHGPDLWFWIHAIQAVGFGVLAIAAFRQLAGMSSSNATGPSFAHRAALPA
jgi:membrane protease YdiL (CAAX protease family)